MFCRCRLKLIRNWFTVFLAGFVAAPVVTCLAEQGQFRVKRWRTDDGLPQNRIGCIHQSFDGYLWVGSWYGLARFNGLDFTVFNQLNTPDLSSDVINAIDESKDGTLWIGTGEGVVSYKDHQFHKYFSGDAFS